MVTHVCELCHSSKTVLIVYLYYVVVPCTLCVFVFVVYLGVVSFYHNRENNILSIGRVKGGGNHKVIVC